MAAHCNGYQGIVHAEFSGKIDFHREVSQTLRLVGRAQISRAADKLHLGGAQIGLLGKSVGF